MALWCGVLHASNVNVRHDPNVAIFPGDDTNTIETCLCDGKREQFLLPFSKVHDLRRGSSDLLKRMSRFQIQLKRLEEAWGATSNPFK